MTEDKKDTGADDEDIRDDDMPSEEELAVYDTDYLNDDTDDAEDTEEQDAGDENDGSEEKAGDDK